MIKREAPERQSKKANGKKKKGQSLPLSPSAFILVFFAACLPPRSPTGFLCCAERKVAMARFFQKTFGRIYIFFLKGWQRLCATEKPERNQ
ncbi:MAG TPA: hypothetical protein VGC89_17475 [Pyrinomonadaceae bacterium]